MSDLDTIFRSLGSARRRRALRCLQRHHAVFLPDLAEYVAECEFETDITTISPERVRNVYFSLYHKHVPTLEDAELVRYDQERDRVARTDVTVSGLTEARDWVDTLLGTPVR